MHPPALLQASNSTSPARQQVWSVNGFFQKNFLCEWCAGGLSTVHLALLLWMAWDDAVGAIAYCRLASWACMLCFRKDAQNLCMSRCTLAYRRWMCTNLCSRLQRGLNTFKRIIGCGQ